MGKPVVAHIMFEGFIVVQTSKELIHFVWNIEVTCIILDEGAKNDKVNILVKIGRN